MDKAFFLIDEETGARFRGEWIFNLYELGARLRQWTASNQERKITIGVSVPTREYAALIIAAGWATGGNDLPQLEYRVGLPEPGSHVSLSLAQDYVTGEVNQVKSGRNSQRVIIEGMQFSLTSSDRWIPWDNETPSPRRVEKPGVEPFLRVWDNNNELDQWTWSMAPRLALIGSRRRLRDEGRTKLAFASSADIQRESLLRLTAMPEAYLPSHVTDVFSAKSVDENMDKITMRQLVIFDGNSASQFLFQLSAAVKVVIIDRSVENQLALEMLMSERSNSDWFAFTDEIQWQPAIGVGLMSTERWW